MESSPCRERRAGCCRPASAHAGRRTRCSAPPRMRAELRWATRASVAWVAECTGKVRRVADPWLPRCLSLQIGKGGYHFADAHHVGVLVMQVEQIHLVGHDAAVEDAFLDDDRVK